MSTKTNTRIAIFHFIDKRLFKVQTFIGLMMVFVCVMPSVIHAQNMPPKISFYNPNAPKIPGTNIPWRDFSYGIQIQTSSIIKNSGGSIPQKLYGNLLLSQADINEIYGTEVLDGKVLSKRSINDGYIMNTPRLSATTKFVERIQCDKNGVVYFVDKKQYIRKLENGLVSTIFKSPLDISDIKVDSKGNVIFVDSKEGVGSTPNSSTLLVQIYSIKKLDTSGKVSLIAGSGKYRYPDSVNFDHILQTQYYFSKSALYDGKGAAASFGKILGISLDAKDNIYVFDEYDMDGTLTYAAPTQARTKIFRKITPDGTVRTIAGSLFPKAYTYKIDATRFFNNFDEWFSGVGVNSFTCDNLGNLFLLFTCNRCGGPNRDFNVIIKKLSTENVLTTIYTQKDTIEFSYAPLILDRENNIHLLSRYANINEARILDTTGKLLNKFTGFDKFCNFRSAVAYDAANRKYYYTGGSVTGSDFLMEFNRDGLEITNFINYGGKNLGLDYNGAASIFGTPLISQTTPFISTVYARNKYGIDSLHVGFSISPRPYVVLGKSNQINTNSLSVFSTIKTKDSTFISEKGFLYALKSANSALMPDSPGVVKVPVSGNKIGNYNTNIGGLTPDTEYDLRGYAINSAGIGLSDVQTVSTNLPPVIKFIKTVATAIVNVAKKAVAAIFDFTKGAVAKINQLTFKIVGNIFKPLTTFRIKLFSTPVTLYEGTVGANGIIDVSLTIPENTQPGLHHIVLEAVDSTGKAVTYTTRINIAEDGTVTEVDNTVFLSTPENRQLIDTIQATDGDVGQTLTYSIIGGADSAKVSIDSLTGILQFKTAPDFEKPINANNTYEVLVQVKDNGNGGEPATLLMYLKVDDEKEVPALNSCNLENTGKIVAIVNAGIDHNGGGTITERGFVYSKKSDNINPLIGGSAVTKVVSTDTSKIFQSIIQGLNAATEYVVKAYASNSIGTTYTNAISFTTLGSASGPFIAYTPDALYVLKNTIAPLTPIQGGTAVPATIYKNVSTFAGALGSASTSGSTNATGTAARFNGPRGMAMDTMGNIYLTERVNHTIRKITAAGVVTTLAGTAGSSGSTDGTGAAARFNTPEDVVIDPTYKYLYVTDRNNHKIRKVEIATGVVSTFAGNGTSGASDDYIWPSLSQFNQPSALAIDTAGNLYVSDFGNNKIRKISAIGYSIDSTTNNALNFSGTNYVEVGGANDLNFTNAMTVEAWIKVDAFDKAWQTIVSKGDNSWRLSRSQSGNNLEFYVNRAGNVPFGVGGNRNINDGKWHHVAGVYNSTVIQVYVDGVLDGQNTASANNIQSSTYKTAIGHNTQQTDRKWKGSIDEVRIWSVAKTADQMRASMHKMLVGNEDSLKAYYKFNQGTAGGTNTGLTTVTNNATSGSSLNGTMTGFALTGATSNWVKSFNNGGWAVSTFAGTGSSGAAEGDAITTATFNQPQNVAVNKSGIVYVSEYGNHKIRKIQNGVVSTLAGSVHGYLDGVGSVAKFNQPYGMAIDGAGNIYVSEVGNHTIRKITPEGAVSLFAGSGVAGSTDTVGILASFNQPCALLLDPGNNKMYVSDYAWNKVRSINMGGYELSHALPKGLSFDYTTGVISGTPTERTFKTYYSNNFNDTALKGASMYGSTAWAGNYMMLTPFENSKAGAFMVPASGKNENTYKINFTLITNKTSGGADGMSYSFADDAAIDATSPAAQVGTGTKLSLSFDDYENSGGERGIRLMYGVKADNPGRTAGSNGLLAYSNNTTWIGKRSNVILSIDTVGRASVIIDGTVIFDKVSLPAAFKIADKSTWKHVFRAVTGGLNDIHGIDNVVIGAGEGSESYGVTANNYYGSYTANVPLNTGPKPLPNISYGVTTKSYLKKTIITPLPITNTGGSIRTSTGLYGTTSVFVGSGQPGSTNGVGAAAEFNNPKGIVYDKLNKVFYVSDYQNQSIRKVTLDGTVTTLAGSGVSGFADGIGVAAKFYNPQSIAVDGTGNVFVADLANALIRKITPTGTVSTFAGKLGGLIGNVNGTGTSAEFFLPFGIAIDENNNLFISDYGNHNIRKITPTAVVSTYAGSTAGYLNGVGTAAKFYEPVGITIDPVSNLYVLDFQTSVVRKIAVDQTVTTYAGSTLGYQDGPAAVAKFSGLSSTIIDNSGNLWITESGTGYIRKVNKLGEVSTPFTGFTSPTGIAIDDYNDLYVVETIRNIIKKVNMQGFTITPALPEGLTLDSTGTISGTALQASPKTIYTITGYNESGSSSTTIEIEVLANLPKISYSTPKIFTKNITIDSIVPINTGGAIPVGKISVVSTFAGSKSSGYVNAVGKAAKFSKLYGITIDKNDNIYVADGDGNNTASCIRKITPNGNVTTLAGGMGWGSQDGSGTAATFERINDLAINNSGIMFLTDASSRLIRRADTAGNVSFVAGNQYTSVKTTDGFGINASFNAPFGITVDLEGSPVLTDMNNYNIRKIRAYSFNPGTTSTFVGNYQKQGKEDGLGTLATFASPAGIVMDQSGNYYVADMNNHSIRKISASGKVTTFAGGVQGEVDGELAKAKFTYPQYLAIDKAGNIYVSETNSHVIRKIGINGIVSTVAGTAGISGTVDGAGVDAKFNNPAGIAVDSKGNLFVADNGIKGVRKIATAGGYKIYPNLPAGLLLDSLGIISGTPTIASPRTTYTIVATNEDGDDTAKIELAVNETATALVPTLTTAPVTSITKVSASTGGNISADGGAAILERGVVWGTTPQPVVTANHTSNGNNTGVFISDLDSLQPNTLYYVRAYATNSAGTAYGNELSFTTSSLTQPGAIKLTVATPMGTMSKVYDGTLKAAITTGTLMGVNAGDLVTLNSTAQYENSAVGTNKKIIVTYSLSGADAAKYQPPVNDTIVSASITPKPLLVEPPTVTKQKTYDGNINAQVAANALIGLEGADRVIVKATATYDTKTAGLNKSITVVYTLDGANAANYQKPLDTIITDGEITKAELNVKAKADAKFAGENDVAGYKGVVITGYVNGETIAQLNQNGLIISRSNSGTNTAGDYIGVLEPSGLTADNYSFTYINGDYSIVPADQLLVRIKDTIVTYGSSPAYVVESAKYFKTGASLVDLTATTVVNADTVIAHDGAVSTRFTVMKTRAINSSSNSLKVGNYSLDTTNVALSVNVTAVKLLGNYTVVAKQVTVDASGGVTKVYDASRDMIGVQLKLNGMLTGDNVVVSGKGLFDSKESNSNKSYSITQLSLMGMDADNYYLSGANTITGSDGTIIAKQLTVGTPTVTTTKLIDGTDTAAVMVGKLNGVEAGDGVNVIAKAAYNNAEIGKNKLIKVSYHLIGVDTVNYIKPVDDSVNNGTILDTLLTISAPTVAMSKEYDGNANAKVTIGTLNGIITGDDVTVTGQAQYTTKNIDTNKTIVVVYTLSGANAAKYRVPNNDTLTGGTITAKQLSVSAPIVSSSKVYDGTAAATVSAGTLSGMVDGENVSISAIGYFDDKNVGANKTIYVDYTLDGAAVKNYIRPTNYSIATGEITPASLKVNVNADAKFVGETDALNYNGVSISGYVNGETIAELDTTQLAITRINSGEEKAGDYDTVLNATGLAANNYSFNYVAGKYSIIPADHLLIKLNTAKTVYGAKPVYSIERAKYFKSAGNVLVDLTATTTIKGDSVEVKDGATKTTLILTQPTAEYSSANQLKVGSYALDTSAVVLSSNVTGVKVIGVQEVSAKTLSIVVGSSVSKEYDGTMSMANLQLTVDSILVNDQVVVSGLGNFDSRQIGTNKTYQLKNIQLSGVDANNYYLQGGNNSLIGNNGTIAVKQLTITSPYLQTSKVYDTTANATIVQLGYLMGVADGDAVEVNATAHYKDAAIGKNKIITVKYSISGADSANYLKPVDYIDSTGEIKSAQTLTISADSLVNFTACAGDTAVAQSFSIAGVGLVGSITITAPKGFELSSSTTGSYDTLLNIMPDTSGVVSSTTIYARMKAQASSPANGAIIISTLGLIDDSVAVRGVVNALPTVASISGAASVCLNGSTTLTNTTADGIWSSSNTNNATIAASGVVTGVAAGTAIISYVVTNASNCKNVVSKTVTVNPLPTVAAITGASSVCLNESKTLTNTTTGGVWSSANTGIATVNTSGVVTGVAVGNATISYAVTNASGCVTTVTKMFTVNGLPTVSAITGSTSVCLNANTTLANTTASGVWSSSNTGIATVTASGTVTGVAVGAATINYTVTNASGCVNTVTMPVTVNALPIVTASINNGKVSKGGNAVLSATGVGTFAWTPAADLVNPDKSNTVARVTGSTTYTVTLTNGYGCVGTATVSVEAIDDFNVTPSNVFTPNGDGLNDRFVIKNIDMYPDNNLVVYDRSGKQVYQATNYANTWNGQINGTTLAKDSYFYILTVKGRVVARGTVTLVR